MTDFFNDGKDGKVAESCSNDGVNVDEAGGGDKKRKVHCEGEADDDDGDNDHDADCDDNENGGGGNSKTDGNEDGIFVNWCVDGEGVDDADNGDEQTDNVAGGLAKRSESSETEMAFGEMG